MIVAEGYGTATPFRAEALRRAPSAAALLLAAAVCVHAQAQQRCDLTVKSTPGAGADSTCLDLAALANGGTGIRTAGNVTRISKNGLRFCKNAFQVQTAAEADVVFIFDNSGSMFAQLAYVDTVTNDTSFFYNGGCRNNFVAKEAYTLQTANGPLPGVIIESDQGCTGYSGDPYEVRAEVIRTALDYIAQTSPTSTAGIMGFAGTTMHALAPMQMNAPANVQQLKDSAIIDSIPATNYGPPLRLANSWLRDPAMTKTSKQAIVFISDGAPNDAGGADSYINSVDPSIPIYSIYLGHQATPDTANLKDLSDRTHGTFSRVDPKNIAGIHQVMKSILQSLFLSTMPRSIEVTNTSMVPPQVSRSVSLVRNADSSISLALDSIIGLRQGVNELQVKINVSDTLTRTYSVKVQADGPLAATSTPDIACYDPPTLTLLNSKGVPDTAYPGGSTPYQVRLTRATNDLGSVLVNAVSRDSTRPQPWGDSETVSLNLAAGGAATYLAGKSLNGSSPTPVKLNGILESDADGRVVLSWIHPRDPREFAVYALPGTRIPVIPPFIQVERVRDVTTGTAIDGFLPDPVVIYGGATLVRTAPDGAEVTHGACLANCGGDAIRLADPAKVPSFVFKTASPFSYSVKVYDHLGNFVNASEGSVDAAAWQTMPRDGDSVAVVMGLVPVARNGALLGSGVYILNAVINSLPSGSRNSAGRETIVPADTRSFLNRFGYLRSRP